MQEVERKMEDLARVGMIARGTRHRLCFTALSPQKHNLYKHVYIFFITLRFGGVVVSVMVLLF